MGRQVIKKSEVEMVKKTVAIHPLMDKYIRQTWSILIEEGHDATYSTALNFMLLAAIGETVKGKGLSKATRRNIWSFVEDEAIVRALNLEDHLTQLKQLTGVSET